MLATYKRSISYVSSFPSLSDHFPIQGNGVQQNAHVRTWLSVLKTELLNTLPTGSHFRQTLLQGIISTNVLLSTTNKYRGPLYRGTQPKPGNGESECEILLVI